MKWPRRLRPRDYSRAGGHTIEVLQRAGKARRSQALVDFRGRKSQYGRNGRSRLRCFGATPDRSGGSADECRAAPIRSSFCASRRAGAWFEPPKGPFIMVAARRGRETSSQDLDAIHGRVSTACSAEHCSARGAVLAGCEQTIRDGRPGDVPEPRRPAALSFVRLDHPRPVHRPSPVSAEDQIAGAHGLRALCLCFVARRGKNPTTRDGQSSARSRCSMRSRASG